jgi:hypothetical protein
VEGVGRLSLPLLPAQAAAMKAVAEQAPHGRGLRTVVDTAVRDAYQVGYILTCSCSTAHAQQWLSSALTLQNQSIPYMAVQAQLPG